MDARVEAIAGISVHIYSYISWLLKVVVTSTELVVHIALDIYSLQHQTASNNVAMAHIALVMES